MAAVVNFMIRTKEDPAPIPFNMDASWNRSLGGVAITGAAVAAAQDELTTLTLTGGATRTVRTSDYMAAIGLGGGVFLGYLLNKAEAGTAFATLMGSPARTSSL